MNAKSFHLIFKQLRSETDLTQKEIASELGVSLSLVAMWETGQRLPSPDLYEQIADYFNVDIDYLYGRTNIRKKIAFDPDGNELHALSFDQKQLLASFSLLNHIGREKALDYISDLAENKKYREDTESSLSKKA